jgi:glutamine cyclotransferase
MLLVGVLALLAFAYARYGTLLRRQDSSRRGEVEWQDMGAVPGVERQHTPQGMAWVQGALALATSWRDERSVVYRIDPVSMQVQGSFDMPAEAVHTSGLSWDGAHLWAVDYVSNRAYRIDWERSLEEGRANVTGSFGTTLRGTSACSVLNLAGDTVLAVSDHRGSRRTVFIDVALALQAGDAGSALVASYRNEGFSQGLVFDGAHLYEAENKWPAGVVNVLDVDALCAGSSARAATVVQYSTPTPGVEDLAWDGEHLWTSDETTFRIYRGTLR